MYLFTCEVQKTEFNDNADQKWYNFIVVVYYYSFNFMQITNCPAYLNKRVKIKYQIQILSQSAKIHKTQNLTPKSIQHFPKKETSK